MIYCLNVFDREEILKQNIEQINKILKPDFIFVASNGIRKLENISSNNVKFKYFDENRGWQLGALNGMFQSLRFAVETIPDIENHIVIFSHDDIFPENKKIIEECCNLIKVFDIVARYYIPGSYYMIENVIFSGKFVKRVFNKNFPIITTTDFAEDYFTDNIVFKNKIHGFGFEKNFDMRVNEMGFIHKHKHD